MYMIVKVPANDTSAKPVDMKELLALKPACYVPYDMRVNGCERERLDAIDALNCAVRYAVKHKIEVPFAKEFLNGLYGISTLQFSDHEGEPDPAGHDAISENVKDESRDVFITINSDHVSPGSMSEVAKLVAVLSDTNRDVHVNII